MSLVDIAVHTFVVFFCITDLESNYDNLFTLQWKEVKMVSMRQNLLDRIFCSNFTLSILLKKNKIIKFLEKVNFLSFSLLYYKKW